MIGKVKRHASRVGLQKSKYLFSINITQLIIANDAPVPPGSVLNICFEKGGKISSSNEIVFDMNRNDVNPLNKQANLKCATIPIDEKVELIVTIYKDSATGLMQVKKGKLILRQLKRNPGLGMDAFKVVGVQMIDLHTLAQELGRERSVTREVTLTMEPIKGCSLNTTITTKVITKRPSMFGIRNSIGRAPTGTGTSAEAAESDVDDTMSVGSIVSDGSTFSTLGATFYYEDLEEYSGKGEGIVGSLGSAASDLHYLSPERTNRSSKQRNYAPQHEYDYSYDSSEGGEGSTGIGSVGGARRRRSGLHVMEVAMHGAERKPIKPLSRRPSAVHTLTSSGKLSAGDTSAAPGAAEEPLSGDNNRDLEPPLSPPPQAREPPSPLGLHTPTTAGDGENSAHTDGAGAGDGVGAGADEEGWEALPSSARSKGSHASSSHNHSHNRSPYGSPYLTGHRKRSVPSQSAHSSPSHRSPHHSTAPGEAADNQAAHQPYDHSETFALYTRELQAREERIAALEARLAHSEEQHRTEVLGLRSMLHSTQAELRLQQQLIIAPSPAAVPIPTQVQLCARCNCDVSPTPLPVDDDELGSAADTANASPEALLVEQSVQTELADAPAEETEEEHPPTESSPPHTLATPERCSPSVRVSRCNNSNGGASQSSSPHTVPSAQPAPSSHVVAVSTVTEGDPSMVAALTRGSVDGTTATPDLVAALFNVTMAALPDNSSTATAAEGDSNADLTLCSPVTAGVDVANVTAGSAAAAAMTALLSEYGHTSAQVQMLAQDVLYYKQLAEEALQAKADETLASREAATVAVQACMRRADCEQELADAMHDLLELQRRYARLSLQCESEQRRNYSLKARLQVYAQKLSAMEVGFSLSLHQLEDLQGAVAAADE